MPQPRLSGLGLPGFRPDGSALLLAVLSLAYPVLAALLIRHVGPWPVLGLLAGGLAARALSPAARRVPLGLTVALLAVAGGVALVAVWDAELAVRLYPVLMNAALLAAFAATLRHGPSMIERFARILEPDLPESGVRYTRAVTMVWVGFLALNGAIALWTALRAGWAAWALYNGVIAYLAMGVLLAAELAVRPLFRGRARVLPDKTG